MPRRQLPTSFTLPEEESRKLDERVAVLRERGLKKASRTHLIRVALEELDFDSLLARLGVPLASGEAPRVAIADTIVSPPADPAAPVTAVTNHEEAEHARPAETAGVLEAEGERTDDPLHIHTAPNEPGPAPREEVDRSGGAEMQGVDPGATHDSRLIEPRVRGRRKHDVRPRTVSARRMSKRELELGRLMYPDPVGVPPRPRTRGECEGGARPCPYVGCKHNLYLDVSPTTGAIKLNFPDREPEDMPPEESCCLDVVDAAAPAVETLERVGALLNVTRERVRQLESRGLDNAIDQVSRDLADAYGLDEPKRTPGRTR